MSARPSAKALITTGICLLGGSLVLQLVYSLVQGIGLSSFYGGYSLGWSMLGLFSMLISMAGYTGAALLGGGLVVKSLTSPAVPGPAPTAQTPYTGYTAPSGYPTQTGPAAPTGYGAPSGYPAPTAGAAPTGYGTPQPQQAPQPQTGGYPTTPEQPGYPTQPGQQ